MDITNSLLEKLIGSPPTNYEYLAYVLKFVLAMMMVDGILHLFKFIGWFGK